MEKVVFNHTMFKMMWNWLADNPDKTDKDFFKANNVSYSAIPNYLNYACECANNAQKIHYEQGDHCIDNVCRYCPIEWLHADGFEINQCEEEGSLYRIYKDEALQDEYNITKEEAARRIAELTPYGCAGVVDVEII